MNRDEFEEQMRPCRACGRLCDGDVCDEYCANMLRAEQEEEDEDEHEEQEED